MAMADRRAYYRDNYALYKAHRVCTMCQREDALPGITVCAACRARKSEYNAKYHAEHPAANARRCADRYSAWKTEGKCVKCGGEPRQGMATCEKCARKRAAYFARTYQPVWHDPGLCLQCSEPVVEGYKYCAEHLAKKREQVVKARQKGEENTPWRTDMWPHHVMR